MELNPFRTHCVFGCLGLALPEMMCSRTIELSKLLPSLPQRDEHVCGAC